MTQETEIDALFALVQEFITKHPEQAERLRMPPKKRQYKQRVIKNIRCDSCGKLTSRDMSFNVRVRKGMTGGGQWITLCMMCYSINVALRGTFSKKYSVNVKENSDDATK